MRIAAMVWFRLVMSVFCAATLLWPIALLRAGEIHPLLRSRLNGLRDDEHISVLVFLEEQADIPSLHQHHVRTAAPRGVRHREVIHLLQQSAAQSQGALLDYLNERKAVGLVDGFTGYWITNCVVVRCAKDEVEKIAVREDVAEVWENFRVEQLQPVHAPRERNSLDLNMVTHGLRAIRADSVWYRLGITGAGRIVANIDNGVNYQHPALNSSWRGNIAPPSQCWNDPYLGSLVPTDYDSRWQHGTHTIGTICGLSSATGDTIGVAWGARWIASSGTATPSLSDLVSQSTQSFQWIADPDGNPNTLDDVPDVVSNSWGVDGRFTGFLDCSNHWNAVIYNAEAAGVVVVFACGNNGPASQSLVSPANIADNDYFVFAVGAANTDGTSWPYPIANFSSRGPSDCDPSVIKPEIVAPGCGVYSASSGSTYREMDGTSMASPHVAGTVALMREADPNVPVEMVKEILMRTARDLGDPGEDNTYGHGMLDAYTAVRAVQRGWSTLLGTITAFNGEPLRAIITLADGRRVQADSTGEFLFYLPGDSTYALQISYWGYVTLDTTLWLPVRQVIAPQMILQLHPQGVLSGQVLDEQFLPVVGAEVRILNAPVAPQHTDFSGEFGFVLPHSQAYGPYIVRYEGQGLADSVGGVEVSAGDTTRIELRLVPPQKKPMGPDGYGYMAFDGSDSDDPAEYDWIEIETDSGGPGTRLNFALNDQTLIVNLPFSFVYYGQSYQQISVCCNGWIAMGVTGASDYRNWPIPHASGPSAIIAPFWEDFDPRLGGSITHYHHNELGCFVVQFERLAQSSPANTYETFQVLLYNPQIHPTRTGDGNIVFQYKMVSDPTGCTIGIEDPSETMGLQYLFDNVYDVHAAPIGNRTAIRFTSGYAPTTGSISGNVMLVPTLLPVVDVMIAVGARHILTNGRGAFTLQGIPAGVHTVVAARSGYELEHVANVMVYPDTMVDGLEFTLYRLDSPTALQAVREGNRSVRLRWHSPFPMAGLSQTAENPRLENTELRAANVRVEKQTASESRSPNSLDAPEGFRIFRNGVTHIEQCADTFYVDTLIELGVYDYWVIALYTGGESDTSNHASIDFWSGTEPGDEQAVPGSFALHQNSPNPFNSATEIRFSLPHSSHVELTIYNVLGQAAEIPLVNTVLPAGVHKVVWDGNDSHGHNVASGLYIYRMNAGSFTQSRKMIMLR
jgi:subtilisin family serine protease